MRLLILTSILLFASTAYGQGSHTKWKPYRWTPNQPSYAPTNPAGYPYPIAPPTYGYSPGIGTYRVENYGTHVIVNPLYIPKLDIPRTTKVIYGPGYNSNNGSANQLDCVPGRVK